MNYLSTITQLNMIFFPLWVLTNNKLWANSTVTESYGEQDYLN